MAFPYWRNKEAEGASAEPIAGGERQAIPDPAVQFTREFNDALGGLHLAMQGCAPRAVLPVWDQPPSLDYWLLQFELLAAAAIGKSEALRQARAGDETGGEK